MLFNSLQYLVFFPIVVILYFIFPFRYRWLWLLTCSYYFYMSWEARYAGLLFVSTFVTYLGGLGLQLANDRKEKKSPRQLAITKKAIVLLSLVMNLGILFFFKYFNFFNRVGEALFDRFSLEWGVSDVNVLLPIGISFYIFQALGYTIDVYRGKIEAERHFGKYALFVSFFPQLLAGPIERASHLLPQFEIKTKYSYESTKEGLLLIGFGLFKKVVIADRVAVLVNNVYNNLEQYGSVTLMIATAFFAVQIYCDFSGYTDMAIGSAKVLGYDISPNFNRPYFSRSITEFWRRWHMTLYNWFRDYIYIPLGGSRVKKYRKHINLMVVFMISGLWHGAAYHFVAWGLIHGFYCIVGDMTKGIRAKVATFLRVDTESFGHRLYQTLTTFAFVCFAWMFFRVSAMRDAIYIIKNFNIRDYYVLFDGSIMDSLGLDRKEFDVAMLSIGVLFFIEWLGTKIDIFAALRKQHLVFRWLVYYALIFYIIIFGSYGDKYNAADFIYFQF
jgi:D-alanyl-lipoteichoic acid acyltransferase DltB (MBOAT superfamily)